MPDEHPAGGQVAVVVAALRAAVLHQQVLAVVHGHLVDPAAAVHVGQGRPVHGAGHLHEALVVLAQPSELPETPGAERVGTAVAVVPSPEAVGHEPPVADAAGVAVQLRRGIVTPHIPIVEVGQAEEVADLVGDDAGRLAEAAAPLQGPAAVGVGADADGETAQARVRGTEGGGKPQAGDAVGVSADESRRGGLHHEKHEVDVAVVVAGVRHPVRTVVVETAEVDVGVGIGGGEDLAAEVAEEARVPGQVVRDGTRGGVDLREGLPLQPELAAGHLVEEVGEAARQAGVEEVGGEGWSRRRPLLAAEPGEDDQRPQAALGGQRCRRRAQGRVEGVPADTGRRRRRGQQAAAEQ